MRLCLKTLNVFDGRCLGRVVRELILPSRDGLLVGKRGEDEMLERLQASQCGIHGCTALLHFILFSNLLRGVEP